MTSLYKLYNTLLLVLASVFLVYRAVITFQTPPSSSVKLYDISYCVDHLNDDGHWYYNIYRAGVLYIQQDYVPAAPRKQRFASRQDAEQVAQLVVAKLQNQQLPIITKKELISHNIAFKPL